MMLALVAILMIVGPLAAVLFLIGAPLFAGIFAYDAAKQRTEAEPHRNVIEPEPLRPVASIKTRRLSA